MAGWQTELVSFGEGMMTNHNERNLTPLFALIDKFVREPTANAAAKRELSLFWKTGETGALRPLDLAINEPADKWISRARPAFLYVMFFIILWSVPIGLIAAVHPVVASQIAAATKAYLAAIPDALWGLFGTGYLGYTAARQWGKIRSVEK